MTRTPLLKATVEQTLDLGKTLWAKGIVSSDIVPMLKAQSYVVGGIHYNASQVAYIVATIEQISGAIVSGKLKASKAKGLHLA